MEIAAAWKSSKVRPTAFMLQASSEARFLRTLNQTKSQTGMGVGRGAPIPCLNAPSNHISYKIFHIHVRYVFHVKILLKYFIFILHFSKYFASLRDAGRNERFQVQSTQSRLPASCTKVRSMLLLAQTLERDSLRPVALTRILSIMTIAHLVMAIIMPYFREGGHGN